MSSDTGVALTRKAVEFFLQLLNRHDQLVLSRDLIRHRETIAELVSYGLLVFESYASEIMVDVMEGQESVEVEIDEAARVGRFTCPETGRSTSIPLEEIRLYRLFPQRLCEEIAAQLEIEFASQALAAPLIANELWFLGNANLGGANVPVFFARRMGRSIDAVVKALEPRSDTEGGVVLFSGPAPNPCLNLPGRHFAVGLIDTLSTETSDFKLIRPYLARIVSGLPRDRADPLFDFDYKSGLLIIRGREKVFKGIQRDIIRWLWKMRDSDQAGFTWAEISHEADSQSRGIDDAFQGKKKREEWIVKVGAARYRLRRD